MRPLGPVPSFARRAGGARDALGLVSSPWRIACAATCALALCAPAAAAGETAGPTLQASASPEQLTLGQSVAVTGQLTGASAEGGAVLLQASPYPYRGFQTVASTTAAGAGGFAFAPLRPDRDERLRVVLASSPQTASPTVSVTVEPRVLLAARNLGPGRTRLSMRIEHAVVGGSRPVRATWFVAARGSREFRPLASAQARERAGGVLYASVILNPPSRRFRYRVCLNPPWEAAMGTASQHGHCPRQQFRVAPGPTLLYAGEGSGSPLLPYPSPAAIAAAERFVRERAGRVAIAVMDSAGRISGVGLHARFRSASVVKVMMLTAYLQMLAAHHRGLGAPDTALLYPMIHISDNEAASAVLSIVGLGAIARVAREAGMQDYAPGVGWWAYTQTSPIDQVRLFAMLGRLIPARFIGYARYLLSTIEPSQSWGIPPIARPAWQVFFKTGALPEEGLFNEVALLERRPRAFEVAVFSEGDPSMAYGEATIEGVGAKLLGSRS